MSTFDCPGCSRSFDSVRGMKVHHAKKHGESIAGVEVECSYCGGKTRERPNEIEDQDRFFCDYDCMSSWQSDNWTEENAPAWNGGDIEVDCAICGVTIEREPNKVEKRNYFLCSDDCRRDMQRQRISGDGNPNWKGGHPSFYGETWPEARQRIRNMDGGECQRCGDSDESHRPAVHHLIPVREFDDPNDAHFDNNMVQLCLSCHAKMERLSPEKQIQEIGCDRLKELDV